MSAVLAPADAALAAEDLEQPHLSAWRRLWPVRKLPLLLVLPLTGFAAAPLVRGPIFASSDGVLHLYQLVEFDLALRGGILFPRWAPDLMAGYGQPLFVFYAPVMYDLAALFHLAGLGFADALKATVLIGMLASALGMYLFGRDLWCRWGGLLAAVAYLYAPYRLVNTYLDGELSQTLAWAWLPWLSWASWRYLQTRRTGWGLAAGLCFAGLIYTHSVTSWLAAIFLALAFAGLLLVRRARFAAELRLGGWLALGLGLASPYWLPALVESSAIQLQRVQTGSYDFHTNLLPLARTLSTQLAHGYSEYVGVNGPAQLGLAQTLVAGLGMVAVLACFGRRRARGTAAAAAMLFALLGAIAFMLMLKPAAPFWEHVPFGHSLQFPDRLLGIMALPLAVLAGGSLAPFRRSVAAPVVALAASALLIYGATARLDVSYVSLPSSFGPREVVESEQSTGAVATTAKGEYTPVWMSQPALASPLVQGYLTGQTPTMSGGPGIQVQVLDRGVQDARFRVTAAQAGPVELPVTYYPGWTASAGAQRPDIRPSSRGLISVQVPAGTSDVLLRFGATPDRRLADAIGLVSLALTFAAVLSSRRRRKIVAAGVGPPGPTTFQAPLEMAGTLAAGGAVLALALAFVPGRLHLETWPSARPEQVSYKDWLQLMGSDVSLDGNHVRVTTVFRTGAAQSAFPLTATVRLMTKETVWASDTQPMPAQGWTTMIPRSFGFDLPLAAGTPPGTYLLELQLRRDDGGILGPDWARLTYDAPRVGPVILGPVTLAQRASGASSGLPPANSDFGPLKLLSWQQPAPAAPGAYIPIGLTWRPEERPSADWTISLHVVDGQGKVWAGHDDQPRLGYNPTSLWVPGQLERDVQMILLPADMPPGAYHVKAGWYDAASKAEVGPQNVEIGSITVQAR
jgi:hypothetical protein